jgi:hypothetical protein
MIKVRRKKPPEELEMWEFKEVKRQLAEMDEMDVTDKIWEIDDEEWTTENLVRLFIGSPIQSIKDFGWELQAICDREADTEAWDDALADLVD